MTVWTEIDIYNKYFVSCLSDVTAFQDVSCWLGEYNIITTDRNNGKNYKNLNYNK